MITLLDGRPLPEAAITFTQSNQRFYLNETGEDLTRLIKQADKRTFGGFDAELSNELLYQENHPNAPEVGSTSVTQNFVDQILTDPLAAPADAAAGVVDTVKKVATSNVALIVAGVVLFGLLIYFVPRRV